MTEHRWKPGQSGNPKGRPKRGEGLADQLRGAMRGQPRQRIIRKIVKLAEGGNLDAIKLVWAYAFGPPPREPLVAIQQNFGERPDLSRLSMDELRQLHHIVARAAGKEAEPEPPLLEPAASVTVDAVKQTVTVEPIAPDPETTPPEQPPQPTTPPLVKRVANYNAGWEEKTPDDLERESPWNGRAWEVQ